MLFVASIGIILGFEFALLYALVFLEPVCSYEIAALNLIVIILWKKNQIFLMYGNGLCTIFD